MSELVRKGIEEAQSDLRKETDELIWQEGILRHVPLVGSIYNWISPAPKVRFDTVDPRIWQKKVSFIKSREI